MRRMFRLVIFDLDGTITQPHLDFQRIKSEMGAAPDEPRTLLEYMNTLSPEKRTIAAGILDRHERKAAAESQLRDGIAELIESLRESGTKVAILTRNSRRSVDTVLSRHSVSVDFVVTRDDAPPKPSPEPVLGICRALGVLPEESLVVGDFRYDVLAGRAAGASTALLSTYDGAAGVEPDFLVRDIPALRRVIEDCGGICHGAL